MSAASRALGLLGTVSVLCIWPYAATADCSISNGTATCTGELPPGIVVSNVSNLIVEDLTANIDNKTLTTTLLGSNAGGAQEPGGDLFLSYTGDDFSITTLGSGVTAQSNGGAGADGQEDSPPFGNATGGAGLPGGGGGAVNFVFESGTASGTELGTILLATSIGGSSGNGGEGEAAFGTGTGGDGAQGAPGGSASLAVVDGSFTLGGGFSLGLVAASSGSDGGSGGEGRSGFGTTNGGNGGDGGAAAIASLTLFDATVIDDVGSLGLMAATSQGGAGGAGGGANTDATAGAANAGDGGDGGGSEGVTVTIDGGTFRFQGLTGVSVSGEQALLIVGSSGGAGGAGGKAENSAADATGGKGGTGGQGGPVKANLNGGSFTVGSAGDSAIFLQSSGGDGGAGGEGQVIIVDSRAQGGDGGKGGAAGSVTVTSLKPGVTISTTSTSRAQHGLRAESVAGSGGDGGEGNSSVIGDGFGGDGGQGGAGGAVDVQLIADISTLGPGSQGIFARSYGGDGGHGGDGNATAGEGKGGSAAGSGPAGDASVTFSGRIETSGNEANAIIVQSVGGFSGDAGSSTGFLAYGAGSESAGAGGAVSVSVASGSSITTKGASAAAVLAQSVGGGGGRGSNALGIGAIGGSGSAGGDGGTVTLESMATSIKTAGQGARALHGASRGGGGGDGGGATGIVALGGAGGVGGNGGKVILSNQSDVTTRGDQADALYGASLGGGGGSAHSEIGIVDIGGAGGEGGDGGPVMAASTGNISTAGDDADGIFLSSIGGGGGDGSSVVSIFSGGAVAIGGRGGQGGSGGEVTFDDQGTGGYEVETSGERARGLYAHSVGGGGGDGGYAVSGGLSPVFQVSVGASGGGGEAGPGGDVRVVSSGSIATKGSNAGALVAHSTGGGGGSAGTTVTEATGELALSQSIGGSGGPGGDGGKVTVASSGDLSSEGDLSAGLAAYSHGGGGGTGGTTVSGDALSMFSASLAVGGAGKAGGAGGDVEVSGSGSISTLGHISPGLYAHSVSGSGGAAGTTVAANAISSASFDLSVGADGGAGKAGGTVTVDVDHEISTKGDISPGLSALSLGGSGGHAGVTVSGSLASQMALNTSVGGKGGSGGDGGAVEVTSDGAISTQGHSSNGVAARSIGGGGGASHFSGSLSGQSTGSIEASVGGSGGSAGDGGAVEVSTAGDISTQGHNARGLSAMSIGGGGGDSGGTVSGGVTNASALGFTVGGDGGASGSGGAVTVTTAPGTSIETKGTASEAILAASIARSGGSAGYVLTGAALSGETGISVGGDGGTGGDAGMVEVSNAADLTTAGAFASGIEARSLAGGGGSAKGAITASALTVGDASITVGGEGGEGGKADQVTVASQGAIVTGSHHAFGVLGQSIGGSGGNGGFAAQSSVTGGEVSGSLSLSIGGKGGDGGIASTTMVTTSSSITTGDFGAKAILAQSVGGSGGAGGSVYSGNLNAASTISADVTVDIGGSGGAGAVAGAVSVDNSATIKTDGFYADGIAAQSIGGNGGDGGSTYSVLTTIPGDRNADIGVDIGGSGGTGQDAAMVSVKNMGAITTGKGASHGILAMSVGGGGGRGGAAANVNVQPLPNSIGCISNPSKLSASIDVGVGGSGGAAGDGGKVEVSNASSLITAGKSARAIYAVSLGGGGGDGGTASSVSFSFDGICSALTGGAGFGCKGKKSSDNEKTTEISVSMAVEVGGSGGAAGNGDSVAVTNQGTIETSGRLGHGIVAHSIGGGGGDGGEGDIGIEAWTNNATANSIADGPADFSFIPNLGDITAGVGGSAGAAGNGGTVSVKGSQSITTSGDHAFAIHAQSIGGGGGNAGAGSTGDWSAVTVGGRGSGGGDGGMVTVAQDAAISTSGEGSVGIFAQSVGGGGGTAGDVERGFSDSWLDLNIGVGLGVQESAGDGGDGGDISVAAGPISTSGEKAHAILAQSVGGSGGIASISGDLGGLSTIDTFAGSAGDRGNGGAIEVTINGPVTVTGRGAQAIVAQSTSGTLDPQDTSGAVTIDVNSDVSASGEGGRAILAQSQGGTSGTITVSIAEGATVSTAAGSAATIGLLDGNGNLITNNGSLIHEGGVQDDSFVIRTNGTAHLTVENNGLIEGSIRTALRETSQPVGAAAAQTTSTPMGITFMNNSGATFGLGSEVSLGGAAGRLTNAGVISAGGKGTVATSSISGLVTQQSSGQTWVDFEFGGANDLIQIDDVAGNSFSGSVQPNPLSGTPSDNESATLTILQSQMSLDSSALTVGSTATVDYSLRQDKLGNGSEVVWLDYKVDYTPWNGDAEAQAKVPDGLRDIINDNHTAFGNSISAMIEVGAPGTDDFVQELSLFLLTTEEVADLVDTYDRFAPGEIFAPSDAALFSSLRFAGDLNSCPGEGSDGQVLFTRQGSCLWLQANGGGIDRQRNANSIEYDESLFGFSLGGQMAVGDGFFLGLAFGYEDSNLSNTRFNGDGNRFQGGVAAKKEIDATTLSASLSGGIASYDVSRQVLTPSGTATAESSPNTNWISAHARVSHVYDINEQAYLKPWFDLGIDHQWQGSFNESGAGAYGLDVEGFSQTLVTVNPVLEVGSSFSLFGAETNASASAGLLAIVSGRDRSTGVRLQGMGGFGPSYEVSDRARPIFADIGANLEVRVHERAIVSVGGQALLAGSQQEYGGTGRLSIFF